MRGNNSHNFIKLAIIITPNRAAMDSPTVVPILFHGVNASEQSFWTQIFFFFPIAVAVALVGVFGPTAFVPTGECLRMCLTAAALVWERMVQPSKVTRITNRWDILADCLTRQDVFCHRIITADECVIGRLNCFVRSDCDFNSFTSSPHRISWSLAS